LPAPRLLAIESEGKIQGGLGEERPSLLRLLHAGDILLGDAVLVWRVELSLPLLSVQAGQVTPECLCRGQQHRGWVNVDARVTRFGFARKVGEEGACAREGEIRRKSQLPFAHGE
jgi:hypothetical protein